MNRNKKLAIVVPSLGMGGMERVACEIGNYFSTKKSCEIILINISAKSSFYYVHSSIKRVTPNFQDSSIKIHQLIKVIRYYRKTIKDFQPDAVLSFGNKWNSITLLACIGLDIPVFVSDRSNPYKNSSFKIKIENSRWLKNSLYAIIKKIIYKNSTGIIAQTELSKQVDQKFLKHPNIKVIGNPIRQFEFQNRQRENIILNVGRFSKFKNQIFLIEAFQKINNPDWKIYFAGDGPFMDKAVKRVKELKLQNQILFLGKVKHVDELYATSKIFAFTSLSEGFPNALAEALSAPVASIAFDCPAGPADLIENRMTGILIPAGDEESFVKHLKKMMKDEKLRLMFEKNSKRYMEKFNTKTISEEYYKFLMQFS